MSSPRSKPSLWMLAALGLLFGVGLALRLLIPADWDPTTFVKFASDDPSNVEYALSLFDEPVLADALGHDGKFFFAQAMDPLYLADDDTHVNQIDRPRYRAQRMLYPLGAWALGFAHPVGVAWALVAVNLIGLAVGSATLGWIARRIGISPWFGLLYLLNVGVIASFNIDGSEIWALNFVLLAVSATYRGSWALTATWLTFAVLTRETAVITAAGLAVVWWQAFDRRRAVAILAIPISAAAIWWAYLRLAVDDAIFQDTHALSAPMLGLTAALGSWVSDARVLEFAVALLLVVGCLRCLLASLRGADPIAWSAAGYIALAVLMSEPVWSRYFDFSRILAPVFAAYVLIVFSTPSKRIVSHTSLDETTIPAHLDEGPSRVVEI